jgi:hypothetical protein
VRCSSHKAQRDYREKNVYVLWNAGVLIGLDFQEDNEATTRTKV